MEQYEWNFSLSIVRSDRQVAEGLTATRHGALDATGKLLMINEVRLCHALNSRQVWMHRSKRSARCTKAELKSPQVRREFELAKQ
jgi:hypothetical protein